MPQGHERRGQEGGEEWGRDPETGPQLNLALQPMLVGGNFRPGLGLELRW